MNKIRQFYFWWRILVVPNTCYGDLYHDNIAVLFFGSATKPNGKLLQDYFMIFELNEAPNVALRHIRKREMGRGVIYGVLTTGICLCLPCGCVALLFFIGESNKEDENKEDEKKELSCKNNPCWPDDGCDDFTMDKNSNIILDTIIGELKKVRKDSSEISREFNLSDIITSQVNQTHALLENALSLAADKDNNPRLYHYNPAFRNALNEIETKATSRIQLLRTRLQNDMTPLTTSEPEIPTYNFLAQDKTIRTAMKFTK